MALALSRDTVGSSVIDRDDYSVYSGSTVSAGANSGILAHTVTRNFSLFSVILAGDGDGEFTIFLNGGEILRVRNSWSEKGQTYPFEGLKISAADVIEVFCRNTSPNNSYYTARVNGKDR